MTDFSFRHFRTKDIPDMRIAFNQAFSDYTIPMNLTDQDFRKKILNKTKISFTNSAGSFLDKRLIGFIFNTINEYEGKLSAYNGGTGVIPDYRGNNLTSRMYDYLLPRFKKNNIEQCILEVISTNKFAIKAYEKIGFKKSKYFHCLKMSSESRFLRNLKKCPFRIKVVDHPSWSRYRDFCDYSTSFLDTLPMLKINRNNETFLEAYDRNCLIGFLIFNKPMGRIEHIAIDPPERGNMVGSHLVKKAHQLCHKKPIYILNINEKYYGLLNFFLRLGFRNEIDQFELKYTIK